MQIAPRGHDQRRRALRLYPPDNTLRASILEDPAGRRQNTRDNTPAVIHTRLVPGDTVSVQVAARGGSENKAKLAMLNPSDSIVDWVAKTLPTMGAGWCPPGILGSALAALPKRRWYWQRVSWRQSISVARAEARSRVEELRLEIMDAANRTGIGAQGLGG